MLRIQSNPERARRVAGREKWSSSSPALICPALDCSRYESPEHKLLRSLRLPLILVQHSGFHGLANSASQLHGIEPCLLPFSCWSHHPRRTAFTFESCFDDSRISTVRSPSFMSVPFSRFSTLSYENIRTQRICVR